MASLLDNPPDFVKSELRALKQKLNSEIPPKVQNQNLLIATWNICHFGRLSEQWLPVSSNKSPKRNLHSLRCIAEIVSRFDVIAIQEVKPEITALREMMKWLGKNWAYFMTDITKGDPGNDERLAFVFDATRVKPSGLVCELVVPEIMNGVVPQPANLFQRQFARTPYAASFFASNKEFILTTLHVFFGKENEPEKREPELTAIANWLSDWAKNSKAFGQNFFALGDFNIDRENDPRYRAFTSTGLTPAPDLVNLPRTIFSREGVPDTQKNYDQIAWFVDDNEIPDLNFIYRRAGRIDFREMIMPEVSSRSLKFLISDHFPLWVEFDL